ncbi:MAG TPA: hypothetical protein PKW51_08945 [Methanoregulaceae archaeon]|jgi:hypothetical protein|nr:hypothetical protein [Methanoregulaceae archaeon]HQO65023.1 hypothetical protein [Syntrophorhabdus sp.]HQP56870.1 hypothetical protein [Syntrophorhabdus sp.]
MSHEIIKSIKIRNGKVIMHSASNNVSPHHFSVWECPSLTKILQEQGQEALDVEILKEYENGMFQQGNNKYTRALMVLRNMEEYKLYDWRTPSWAEYDEIQKRRSTPAFKNLLSTAMKTKPPKDKFIISMPYRERTAYIRKLTSRHAFWSLDQNDAKIFSYRCDAVNVLSRFANTDTWNIEKVA